MDWFRWHHGTVTDPKFQWVARKAGVSVSDAVAVWAALLERASTACERGSLDGFDCSDYDVLFNFEDGVCARILAVMADKGLVADGCVVNWTKRQPKREDDSAAERKRRQRDKQVPVDVSHNVTQCHAENEDVPLCHTASQTVPPRLDKIREDNIKTISAPAKRKRSHSVPDDGSDHCRFTRWWCYAFESLYGSSYLYTGKDGDHIKKLLAAHPLNKLVAFSAYLLVVDDSWFEENGVNIGTLLSGVNKIASRRIDWSSITSDARGRGIVPPDGVKFEDWKFWEVNGES